MDEKAKESDEATSEYVRAGPMPVALQGGKRRLGKESFDPTPPLCCHIHVHDVRFVDSVGTHQRLLQIHWDHQDL